MSESTNVSSSAPAPAGQLVDIGGFRLHLTCQGHGSPSVILDAAGWGDFSLTWSLVQPEVAKLTHVCAYDRAGYGWSEPSPRPRTVAAMVNELHSLLAAADVPGPYVLVGHSFSGVLVRLYAHTYPNQVAGMVLVDSAHEEQFLRFPKPVLDSRPAVKEMLVHQYEQMKSLLPAGSLDPQYLPVPPELPEPVRDTYRALLGAGPAWIDATVGELEALDESHAEVRAAAIKSLGDIPLVVIRHGVPQPAPGMSDAVNQEYEKTWQQMQVELVGLSRNGRLVVAEGAGHAIHHERPELVVQAIADVVEQCRQRGEGRAGQ